MRLNADYFDLMVGDILTRLYAAIPEPIDLDATAVSFNAIAADEDVERMANLWSATVRWLADEGYIRFANADDPRDDRVFAGAVLTTRGLKMLRQHSAKAEDRSFGERLLQTDPSSDAAKKAVRQMLEQIADQRD